MTLDDRKNRLRDVDVLVVEDDEHQCEALRNFLEMSRLTFEIANDGLAALELLERFDPKVVILDIRLPGLDGIEIAKRISMRERVPVTILVSGHLDSVVEANLSPSLRFRVLEKPVDLRLIGSFIKAVMDRSAPGDR